MRRDLASLPPELLLYTAELVDQGGLCSLLRVAKFLHFLLWPVLYKREIAQPHPIGFIRCIRLGSATAVSKFIAAGVNVNIRIDTGDLEDFTGYTYPLATAVVRDRKEIVSLLLRQGADVNAKIEGFLCYTVLAGGIHAPGVLSPLTVAVALGRIDIAAELTREGSGGGPADGVEPSPP